MVKENLVRYEQAMLAKGTAVRHVFRVVSNLESDSTVRVASNVVRFGHRGQIPDMHNIAFKSLEGVGKPTDTYEGSTIVNLEDWRKKKVFGQYHDGDDTFAYTEFVPTDDKGSERVETVAFTSKTRQQVRASLGELSRRTA